MGDLLQNAENALRKGDEDEVWGAVDQMPPIEHGEPTIVDLKVRTITAFQRFERQEARQWADLLSFADDKESHRLTIAEFFWHRAAWFLEKGEVIEAARSVKEALEACPEIQGMMDGDTRLDRFFS